MTHHPYLAAVCAELLTLACVWLYARTRLDIGATTLMMLCAVSLPVELGAIAGRPYFAADFVAPLLLTALLLRRKPLLPDRHSAVICALALFSLALWPAYATYYAMDALGEWWQPGDFAVHVYRVLAFLIFFRFAYSSGREHRDCATLLAVPLLFWASYVGFGLLQEARLLDVNAFWSLHQNDMHRGLMNTGFMGFDKPQAAQWGVYMTVVALALVIAGRGLMRLVAAAVPVLSLSAELWLGSRQGALLVVAVAILTLALLAVSGQLRTRLAILALPVALALIATPALWLTADAAKRAKLSRKFEVLTRVSSAGDLAQHRDPGTLPLVRYLLERPARTLIGSGVTTERPGGERGGNIDGVRTYAEGEYLRIFFAGGVVSLLGYVALLAAFGRAAFREGWPRRMSAVVLLATLAAGGLFALGQFHLFTTRFHNVPIGYLVWTLLGVLSGATRPAASIRTHTLHVRVLSKESAPVGWRSPAVRGNS